MGRFFYSVLILSISFASHAQTDCTPALKPDLNNDGLVNYKDIWMVGHSFNLSARDHRYIKLADTNCDGKVDNTDWVYVWEAKGNNYQIHPQVTGGVFQQNIPAHAYVGLQYDFKAGIRLFSDNVPYTARVTQSVTPIKGLGLTAPLIKKDYKIGYNESYSQAQSKKFPVYFQPEKAGEYQFKTQVEILETGKILQEQSTIIVLPARKAELDIKLTIMQPTFFRRDRLPYIEGGYLTIYLLVKGDDVQDITKMSIIDEQPYHAYRAHELDRPVQVEVSRKFFMDRQCKSFHAVIETDYDRVESQVFEFCGSPLKTRPDRNKEMLERYLSRPHKPIIPEGMQKYICQANKHISIGSINDMSSEAVHELVKNSGGKVVFQMTIPFENTISYYVEPALAHLAKDWFDLYARLDANDALSFVNLTSVHQTTMRACHLETYTEDFKEVIHDSAR